MLVEIRVEFLYFNRDNSTSLGIRVRDAGPNPYVNRCRGIAAATSLPAVSYEYDDTFDVAPSPVVSCRTSPDCDRTT